jgi:hypothetical protein
MGWTQTKWENAIPSVTCLRNWRLASSRREAPFICKFGNSVETSSRFGRNVIFYLNFSFFLRIIYIWTDWKGFTSEQLQLNDTVVLGGDFKMAVDKILSQRCDSPCSKSQSHQLTHSKKIRHSYEQEVIDFINSSMFSSLIFLFSPGNSCIGRGIQWLCFKLNGMLHVRLWWMEMLNSNSSSPFRDP